MSVINDALRRLDRQEQGPPAATAQRVSMANTPVRRAPGRFATGSLAVAFLVLLAGGYLVLSGMDGQRSGTVAVASLPPAEAATLAPAQGAAVARQPDGAEALAVGGRNVGETAATAPGAVVPVVVPVVVPKGAPLRLAQLDSPPAAGAEELEALQAVTAADGSSAPASTPPQEHTTASEAEFEALQAVTASDRPGPAASTAVDENPAALTEPAVTTAPPPASSAPGDVSELTTIQNPGTAPAARERGHHGSEAEGPEPGVDSLTTPDPAAAGVGRPAAAPPGSGEHPGFLTQPETGSEPSPSPPAPRTTTAAPAKTPSPASPPISSAASPPIDSGARLAELRSLLAQERYSEGSVLASQWLENAENQTLREFLVQFAARAGDHAAAARAADALPARGVASETLFWSGYSRLRTGAIAAAAQDFHRAVVQQPDNARLWFFYGLARQEAADHAGAIEAFHRARALDPDLPEIAYNTGLSWWALGERDKARAAFRHFMQSTEDAAHRYATQRERLTTYLKR